MLPTHHVIESDNSVEGANRAVHEFNEGTSSGWLVGPCQEAECLHCAAPGEAPVSDNGDSPSSEGLGIREEVKPKPRARRRSNVDKELRNTTNKSNKKAKA